MAKHGLEDSVVVSHDAAMTRIARCQWLAPPDAEPDGFIEIRVFTEEGPEESEASGASLIDRILAPCPQVSVRYSFSSQGVDETLPVFQARQDTVMTAYGESWKGNVSGISDLVGGGEPLVVHNTKTTIVNAWCGPPFDEPVGHPRF